MSTVPINARAIAPRATRLRTAREAAGLTIEALSALVVDAWDARQGNGRRAKWQQSVERVERDIGYLERASQGAYERADAWAKAWSLVCAGGMDKPTGRAPRVSLYMWREALAVIERRDPAQSHREASDALTVHTEERAQERALEQGQDIATLVWNGAEEVSFLDSALFHELGTVAPQHLKLVVRASLVELANEIRSTFPDRPARELRPAA